MGSFAHPMHYFAAAGENDDFLTLIRLGGGNISPPIFQIIIALEPNVGSTSDQAVNSSLSVVPRSKKKIDQFGPWKDHGGSFQCTGPSIFSTFYGLTQIEIIIGYFFAFYATQMGSRATGDTKVHPYWVKDPPWSFNGPCHGPTIH